jgi:energy-coupling factor transporter ATP-binding protein EcfA2
VERLFAALGKDYKREDEYITTRDIIMNLDIVKAMAPRLLTDFTKIDRDGLGRICAKQLEDCVGPPSRELSRYELQQVWERLLSGRASDAHLPQDRIFLQDMSRHLDFVSSRVPGLLENFHQIDTDRSSSIERAEFDAFFGNGEAWLEARLAQVIGLESLKKQIRTFYWATRLDGLRKRSGSFVDTEEAHVLMFRGNPGVGKTTIARLVAGLLHKIGIIPTDTLVEVQRDQLVGDHIGATEKATEEAISRASGGVLFVDEAYRLSVDIFGVEAINCLMKAMTQRGRVIVLAGYPDEMDKFVSANPGLKRRITYEFTFPDYSPDDLARIFTHQVTRRGFEIDPQVTVDSIAGTISRLTTELQRRALNGGAGEHMCRHAVFSLNSRQVDMIRASENAAQFVPSIMLNMQDIEHGCRQVPHAPTSHKA